MIPTIPIKTQFCVSGANSANEFVISLDTNMDTASTIPNSIAYHVQCGHDSFGMCTLECEPIKIISKYCLFNFSEWV